MTISVNNMAPAGDGPLRELSIGFCGSSSILGAAAQSGWSTEIEQKDNGYVTWSLPDAEVERLGIPSRARVGGFVVRLKPGWRKSQWISVRWGHDTVGARTMTHDCWAAARGEILARQAAE